MRTRVKRKTTANACYNTHRTIHLVLNLCILNTLRSKASSHVQ